MVNSKTGWFGEKERHKLSRFGVKSNKTSIKPVKINFRNSYHTHVVGGKNISLGDEIIFPSTHNFDPSKGCVVFVSDDLIYVMLTKWGNRPRQDLRWVTLWDYELEKPNYKIRKNIYPAFITNPYITKVKHDIEVSP
jgi:hypothetical protein